MTQEAQTEQQQPEPLFTFQLTLQDCNYIFAGLGEVPTKIGKPIMDKMQAQFAQQQPVTQEPAAE